MGHQQHLPLKGRWKLASLYPISLMRSQESNVKSSSCSDAGLRWEMWEKRRCLPHQMGGSLGKKFRAMLLFPSWPMAEEVKGRGRGHKCSRWRRQLVDLERWLHSANKLIEQIRNILRIMRPGCLNVREGNYEHGNWEG